MYFPDIVESIDNLKRSKIKKIPCHTNRASSLGDECERKLYYMRVDWEKAEETPLDLQYRFEDGHDHEQLIIRDMRDSGYKIIRQQEPFTWPQHCITGSIDGMIVVDDGVIPFDAKTCSTHVWQKINDVESLKKFHWTAKYVAQIVIYMLMSNQERGILIFKNKDTGRLKQINFILDDFLDVGEQQIQKADRINAAVVSKIVPEGINDISHCKYCQFRLHCLPDQNLEPLDMVDDEELAEMLSKKESMSEFAKEYDELCEKIKAAISGKEMICCNWHITGKWVEKKESIMKASKYWLSKIHKID